MRFLVGVLAMVVSTTAAFAVDCDSLVVDDGHIFSDASKVDEAARRLGTHGATVRVRTFTDVGGNGSMDRHVIGLRDQCRDWQSPDGKGWKSTMLVVAYANEGRQKGVYYGPAIQAKVGDGKWINVLKTTLVPLEIAYYAGEKVGMTNGFVAALGGLQSLMAATPGGGNVTINNSTSTDYSKVWMIFLLLLAGGAAIAFIVMVRREKGKVTEIEREAKRVRALCVSGMSEISSQTTEDVLGAIVESELDEAKKVVGRRQLAQFKQYVRLASGAISQFEGDPDAKVTASMASANKRMYMTIIDRYINPAKELMASIKAKDFTMPGPMQARKTYSGSRFEQAEHRQRRPWSPPPASVPTSAASPTNTVHHHHYDSGPVFVPTPVVVVETPSYTPSYSRSLRRDDDSSSSSWGSSLGSSSSSSDSGGSYSSSSDSGSSSSSDSGGSFSSD
jgi:uncharacterized membrane protein YgcG